MNSSLKDFRGEALKDRLLGLIPTDRFMLTFFPCFSPLAGQQNIYKPLAFADSSFTQYPVYNIDVGFEMLIDVSQNPPTLQGPMIHPNLGPMALLLYTLPPDARRASRPLFADALRGEQ